MNYSGDKRGSVVVAVRPENMIMRTDKGILRGKMLREYYLGDVNDCRVDVDGTTLRVISSGSNYGKFNIGEELWLDFNEYLVFNKA